LHESFFGQHVDLLQHGLPRDAHRVGDLRDVGGVRRHRDGAQHLPARAGQAVRRGKGIAPFDQQAVQPEHGQRDGGQLGGFRHGRDT